ncbi:MAG: hypothetical protein ACJA2X_000956 [Halocynthiibacter sp.]
MCKGEITLKEKRQSLVSGVNLPGNNVSAIEYSPKSYLPSGHVSPVHLAFFAVTCLVISPLLSFCYASFIYQVPNVGWGDLFEILNPLAAAGFGYTIALLSSFLVIKCGHVRSPLFASWVGLFVGLECLYLQWGFWVALVDNYDFIDSLFVYTLRPQLLWDRILEINMTGTWVTHFRSEVPIHWTGSWLFVVWVLEALLVVVFAPIKCHSAAKIPYSEADRKWFRVTRLADAKLIENPQEIVAGLSSGKVSILAHLEKKDLLEHGENRATITLYHQETGCGYLTVTNAYRSDEGWQEYDVVTCVEIDEVVKEALLELAADWQQAVV